MVPSWPHDLFYTPNFCEENVYRLVQRFASRPELTAAWMIYAVFISNANLSVALWQQRSPTARDDGLVVWDYHCIAILVPNNPLTLRQNLRDSWVYDGNSLLGIPTLWTEYVHATFQPSPEAYSCKFRAVRAADFLDWFASDRSHMLAWDDELKRNVYLSPPPKHPPIAGRAARKSGVTNNLMKKFVSMEPGAPDEVQYGVVLDEEAFMSLTWCDGLRIKD